MSKFRRQLMMASMGEPVPPTPPLPYDAEVEYLTGDGNSYVDLGYYPNTKTVMRIKYYAPATNVSACWVRWTGASTYDSFGPLSTSSSKQTIYYGRYSSGEYKQITISYWEVIDLEIGLTAITLNGTSYAISRSSFQSTYPISLFKANNMGAISIYGTRIYAFSIVEDGVTLFDYIPVRVGSVGYFYDRVSRQLFGNDGTGAFILGADV